MFDIFPKEYYDLFVNGYNIAVVVIGGAISAYFYYQYNKTKSRALLNCLPGVFTSLGLLCTFISICVSLHDISITEKANLAAGGSQAYDIAKIIEKLVPAFTSSICGLICALIATVWAKYIFANEEKAENEQLNQKTPEQYIQEIAENSFVIKSVDSLLAQINRQQAKLITMQEDQDKNYREYNEKLNNNIVRQNEVLKDFIDGFVNRMDDIFKQMHEAVEQQVKNFGEEQFAKTSELLATITDNMSKVSTDIITQQKNSVETMLSQTNNGINDISTSFTKNLEMLSTQLTVSLSTLGSEQGEKLNSLISNYDSLATKLSEQNSTFAEKVQQHNTESIKQMTELKDKYKDLTKEMLDNALSMNEKTSNNIRESLGGFVENIQSTLSGQCTILSKSIADNVESLNKAYSFIESLVAEIKQNYDQAVIAYGNAVDVAHRTNESSEKAIAATNKSLASVEETNEKIGSVLDILTERQDNLENLTKQIVSMSATIESLQKLEFTLNKLVNK